MWLQLDAMWQQFRWLCVKRVGGLCPVGPRGGNGAWRHELGESGGLSPVVAESPAWCTNTEETISASLQPRGPPPKPLPRMFSQSKRLSWANVWLRDAGPRWTSHFLISGGTSSINKRLTPSCSLQAPGCSSYQPSFHPAAITSPSFPPISPLSSLTHLLEDSFTRATNIYFPATFEKQPVLPSHALKKRFDYFLQLWKEGTTGLLGWSACSSPGCFCFSSSLSSAAPKYRPVFTLPTPPTGPCHSDIHLHFSLLKPKSSHTGVDWQEWERPQGRLCHPFVPS